MVATNFVIGNALVFTLIRVSKQLLDGQVVFQGPNSISSLNLLCLLRVLFLLFFLVSLFPFFLGIILIGLALFSFGYVLDSFDLVLLVCHS